MLKYNKNMMDTTPVIYQFWIIRTLVMVL